MKKIVALLLIGGLCAVGCSTSTSSPSSKASPRTGGMEKPDTMSKDTMSKDKDHAPKTESKGEEKKQEPKKDK